VNDAFPLASAITMLGPHMADTERAEATLQVIDLLDVALVAALAIAERPEGEHVDANYHEGATTLLTSLLYMVDNTDLLTWCPSIDRARIVLALSRQAGRTA
jgi:hypothetical protein